MTVCRECGAELVAGENWWASRVEKRDYICIECGKAKSRQWRAEHRAEKAAYNYKYYTEHHEECLATKRRWREDNPDYHRQYSRQYYAAHREEKAEHGRQWCKDNPGKACEKSHRYRARKNGAAIGPADEAEIYELYNRTCIYCGATERLTIDHIVPLNGGGLHYQDNLVVACHSCNSSKRDKPLIEWLQTQPYAQAWVA